MILPRAALPAHRGNNVKDAEEREPRLRPVDLPHEMSEREAAEFAEGVAILERLSRQLDDIVHRLQRREAGER